MSTRSIDQGHHNSWLKSVYETISYRGIFFLILQGVFKLLLYVCTPWLYLCYV